MSARTQPTTALQSTTPHRADTARLTNTNSHADAHPALRLQRAVGNQAVQRLLRSDAGPTEAEYVGAAPVQAGVAGRGAPARSVNTRESIQRSVPPGTVQRQFVTPLAPGGGFGGVMQRDRQAPTGPASTVRRALPPILHFYHGTRWSIAQNIGRIEHRGIGDFGLGFYTHFEPENDQAAMNRARDRGRWAASQQPQEPYAGVLDFHVPSQEYQRLLNTRSRAFPLHDVRQPDYADRQREWLDYVTTHGREPDPRLFSDQHTVERWRHFELPSPQIPPQALTIGPFYTPLPGLPGPEPPRSAFQPAALERATDPNRLQQQVVWANEGLDLLNASRRDVLQFDRRSGERIDPPVPATAAPPPQSQVYTSQNPSDQ